MMRPFSRTRLFFVVAMIIALSGAVLAQLVRLQVVEHDRWDNVARQGRAGQREVTPERGRIWDRNGVLLVGNEPR
ncbi:MAG: penicillin-binding protein 2, partial [Anaerolineae bacterium]